MEKILNDSEKIRRAEKIYAKRNGIELDDYEGKSKNLNIYKIGFKIILLVNIILSIWTIENKEFIFSQEFLEGFNKCYSFINKKVNDFIKFIKDEETQGIEKNDNTKSVNETTNINPNSTDESISSVIKSKYSVIRPIDGIITSKFGQRQSTNKNISSYHSGIDISAKEGTIINSAIEGTVTKVSKEGNYRKSYRNKKI